MIASWPWGGLMSFSDPALFIGSVACFLFGGVVAGKELERWLATRRKHIRRRI